MMRPRRQVRPALPGFSLDLPTNMVHSEVQVQQKNEKEFDKFFIDTDDSMVSPMVTTNPFHAGVPRTSGPAGGGTFNAVFTSTGTRRTEAPAGSYVAALTATSPPAMLASGGGGAKAPPHLQSGTAAPVGAGGDAAAQSQPPHGAPGGSAKFIHVNNTNIFVLVEGVSMFFEGKSTFNGSHDPYLVAQLQKKKKERREQEARSGKSRRSLLLSDEQPVSGRGSGIDTVVKAIQDIEENVANTSSPVGPSPQLQTVQRESVPVTPSAAPPVLPEAFASLFKNASRPAHAPLFRHRMATAVDGPPSPNGAAPVGHAGGQDTMPYASSTTASVENVGGTVVGDTTPVSSSFPVSSAASCAAESTATSPLPANANPRQKQGKRTNRGRILQLTGEVTSLTPTLAGPSRFTTNSSFASVASSVPSGSTRHIDAVTLPDLASPTAFPSLREEFPDPEEKAPKVTSVFLASKATKALAKERPVSMNEIGHSNRSLDIDEVEFLNLIGCGSQGKVYCVRLDGKLYALKCLDIKEATQATNAVERQGRKRGLVKELKMITLQRERAPPKHLMQMFNAVMTTGPNSQLLNLLIEIMSFGLDNVQGMVARIPQNEVTKLTQTTFRDHMKGNQQSIKEAEKLIKQQPGSCMHLLGRSKHAIAEAWEKTVERQTCLPEIILSMVAADVLRGLKELHDDYNIVHCDLKPANVLLCYDRQSFKIADFGCGSAMDPNTKKVRHSGVDLGSKLYKAPERVTSDFCNDMDRVNRGDSGNENENFVEYTAKSDVWSLGIMLLELGSGAHPCTPFKSEFWDYTSLLKLSKMVKPLSWSNCFCDFVVRCLSVDVDTRWTVNHLLKHPFIIRHDHVPRTKLKMFMDRLEKESASFQLKQQRELLRKQIELSTAQVAKDTYQCQSRDKWGQFNSSLRTVPDLKDTTMFPRLE